MCDTRAEITPFLPRPLRERNGESGQSACAFPAAPSPDPPPAREGGRFSTSNLILGVGNIDRGDDAVGHVVADLLRPSVPSAVRIIQHDGEATALLFAMQSADSVWLIDAAHSGASPGTIHCIDCATDAPLPRSAASSHGFGVAEAIGLARELGTLPPHCIVYAIEAADFTIGAPLSPAVTRAAHEVAARIAAALTPRPPSAHRPLHPAPVTNRR